MRDGNPRNVLPAVGIGPVQNCCVARYPARMTRYFLRHPPDPRPSLVVQTGDRVDEATVREFKELLFGLGCSTGILFDPDQCRLIRDTFASLDLDSLQVDRTIATESVLERLNRPGGPRSSRLERRVAIWLDMLAANWEEALSTDPAVAAPFLTDIVPAATGATISAEHDAEDAA